MEFLKIKNNFISKFSKKTEHISSALGTFNYRKSTEQMSLLIKFLPLLHSFEYTRHWVYLIIFKRDMMIGVK